MKIAVIGANGNLGKRVTGQALDRGHEVTVIIRGGEASDPRVKVLKKNMFDVTAEDISEMDAVISTFGSGFQADPVINKEAFEQYIRLVQGSDKHIIVIAGAGSLYSDDSHTAYCYEQPEHPAFLREISYNIHLGIEKMKQASDVTWTVVCPSTVFDPDGPYTGDCVIGCDEQVIFNDDGESYVTYDDLAKVMVDIAEDGSYPGQMITVATRKAKA